MRLPEDFRLTLTGKVSRFRSRDLILDDFIGILRHILRGDEFRPDIFRSWSMALEVEPAPSIEERLEQTLVCNLYRVRPSVAEVAGLFGVAEPQGLNVAEEVYPGYPGLVVTAGALHKMTWGFPLPMKGKTGQPIKPKAVNNTRTDKLATSFWKPSFERRRCLIPISAFAEAEGPKGSKTRTWLSVPDQPVFAAAGIWRESVEWGLVYSMVMTKACLAMGDIHDRMPVLLAPEDYGAWLDGTPAAAFALCRPYEGELAIERTDQLWVKR